MSKKTKKKSKSDIIFVVLYLIGFIGAGIIGFFSNSYFAYDKFNSTWANVLYILFLSLLYVTAFVQEVFRSRLRNDIILNGFIFLGGVLFFVLSFVLGGVFSLCALIYSAVLCAVVAVRYVIKIREKNSAKAGIKQVVCIASLILFPMVSMLSVDFVNETYMLWALIPAAVILCVSFLVAVVLLHEVWSEIIAVKWRRVLTGLGVAICVFFCAFAYCFTAIGLINCVFDGEPEKREYEVLDKKVVSGARTVTRFEIKVEIAEKERWITLPVTDYHGIDAGDTVIIDYYGGALNFAYFLYGGKG